MTRITEEKYQLEFGQQIAGLRQKAKLTQEQLAEKSGLTVRTIASVEQGWRWARLSTLHKIAKGLEIETKELFSGLKQ